MPEQVIFGMEVFLNGLMAGVLYALVALGFVLIYKASGIFNYAQGVMALFSAMTLVGMMNGQVPFSHLINAVFGTDIHHFGWHLPALIGILLTMAIMVLLAWLVQKIIFKHLVNQEPIILFMATIGLAYFMEGFGEFSKMLSGSKFVGNFTVVGQDLSKLTSEEYSIKSVKKMPEGDMWLFVARIKYGKRDMSVPIPLEVRWAGDDTPVITVTDFSIFGYGPFSARVVIYNGKYAGTWSHGAVNGHLFGVIKQGEAEQVEVEKYQRKMKSKAKEMEKLKKLP